MSIKLTQGLHVDDETVPHVPLQCPLIRLIHLLDRNQLDIGRNVMVGAVIEHVLRLAQAAHAGTRKAPSFENERERFNFQCLGRDPDHREHAVAAYELEVGVHIVGRGDRIKDKIESIRESVEIGRISEVSPLTVNLKPFEAATVRIEIE